MLNLFENQWRTKPDAEENRYGFELPAGDFLRRPKPAFQVLSETGIED